MDRYLEILIIEWTVLNIDDYYFLPIRQQQAGCRLHQEVLRWPDPTPGVKINTTQEMGWRASERKGEEHFLHLSVLPSPIMRVFLISFSGTC